MEKSVFAIEKQNTRSAANFSPLFKKKKKKSSDQFLGSGFAWKLFCTSLYKVIYILMIQKKKLFRNLKSSITIYEITILGKYSCCSNLRNLF